MLKTINETRIPGIRYRNFLTVVTIDIGLLSVSFILAKRK